MLSLQIEKESIHSSLKMTHVGMRMGRCGEKGEGRSPESTVPQPSVQSFTVIMSLVLGAESLLYSDFL